jgi:4-amino-4-deoxy-L-arabinose transferase-like glycosyltransferase
MTVTENLLALLFLLLLIGLSYGTGRFVLARVPGGLGMGERFVFGVPIGMGIVGYLVLAFGLIGVLKPLYYALLALGLAGWAFVFRDAVALRKPQSINDAAAHSPLAIVIWAAIAIMGLATFIAALAPPVWMDWDGLSYHLAAPKSYLAAGRIIYLPYDHHSNFPFTLEMLFLLMLGVGSIGAAKLCHWLCGALIVASVYTFAKRHIEPGTRGRIVGAVAALIVASTPMALWESTVGYADLATALFTWLSLYALINATSAVEAADGKPNPTSVPWLIVSAVLMGFALGTKYTVLGFWGMLLIGILGWHIAVYRRWAKETIPHAALWAGISLAIGAVWYIKNVINTGNPVYPFAYSIFGGKYWSAENAAQYATEQATFGPGKSPLALLLAPWQMTMLPDAATAKFTEYIVFAMSPVYVGLLLAVPLVLRRPPRVVLYLALFSLGIYGFWFFVMQQTRYLLPALPAMAILCSLVVVTLGEAKESLARWFAALLVGASALWGIYLSGGLAFWDLRPTLQIWLPTTDGKLAPIPAPVPAPVWPVVSGQVSKEEFVASNLAGLGRASQWINANTPKDAKVALFEVRGFYLDREYLWAQPDHAAGLLPWDEYKDVEDWLSDFKKRGLTTILLGIPLEGTDGKRWRSLLSEAIQNGKVTEGFSAGPAKVYLIP